MWGAPVIYGSAESLSCTSKTNRTLYVNDAGSNIKFKKMICVMLRVILKYILFRLLNIYFEHLEVFWSIWDLKKKGGGFNAVICL